MTCPQIVVNCSEDCPAQHLKNLTRYGRSVTNWNNWVNYCENLRRNECMQILKKHRQIRLYILTESIPYSRFIYDPLSNYRNKVGLRTRLCNELLNITCPQNISHCNQCPNFNLLLEYLRSKGILIVNCALCPLHKMNKRYKDRRDAATICLNNNTEEYLKIAPDAPIITIFPCNCGFLRRQKLHIQKRIKEEFNFTYISGLKDAIQDILGDP